MRARCERHALALGPSGCLLCRREQASGSAPPSDVAPPDAARVVAVPSGPPTIPSIAPALPAAHLALPPLAPEPPAHEPDSAPTAPTFTDAPPPPALSIRIPPFALLLPIAAITAYALLAHRPSEPTAPSSDPAARIESSLTSEAQAPAAAIEQPAAAADDEAAENEGLANEAAEPPDPPEVVARKIAELERSRAQAQQLAAARRRVRVTLYMNDRCKRCIEAKSHLLAQGIFPVEKNIDRDARARARHRALTRKRGLPTIEVDGKVLVGFRPERLDKAIERAATARLKRKR